MCKIRIVRKSPDHVVLSDQIVSIETALDAIERPSYVEFIEAEKKIVIFHYAGSTEKYYSKDNQNLSIKYGESSGRIKEVQVERHGIFETDIFNLKKEFEGYSIRFQSNLENGLKLADDILQGKYQILEDTEL